MQRLLALTRKFKNKKKHDVTNSNSDDQNRFFFIQSSSVAKKIIWDKILNIKSEALWVFLGQAGIALGVLLGVKILTHVLNPIEFGRLALANTVIVLIGTNLFGPVSQGLMRFWSISQGRGEKSTFAAATKQISTYLIYVVILISTIIFIFLVFSKWANWTKLLTIALIVGAVTGWNGIKISILTAARKRKFISLINTGSAFGKPVIAFTFVILVDPNADWAMMGYLVTTLIIFYLLEKYYQTVVKRQEKQLPKAGDEKEKNKRLLRDILSFSWPFYIWGIFSWVHQSCDRWSLQTYHGAEVVGAFSVITYLALYPLIFGSSFLSTLFIPIAYERAGELASYRSMQSANRILFVMTGIFVGGSLLLVGFYFIFSQKLVLFISNINYIRYAYLLPWLTISWAFFYLGQMLSGFGLLINKPRVYILPIVVSGTIAAGLTFYLSSNSGPRGVVLGLGIAGLIHVIWCMAIAWKLLNFATRKVRRRDIE